MGSDKHAAVVPGGGPAGIDILRPDPYVLGFAEIDATHVAVVGGKGAHLGELSRIDGIRVIQFAQNRGAGAVRRHGTRAARGEVVVWTDADMTYPNEEIPRLVAELDGYDQVVGARRTEEGTAKFLRVPAKWFIRWLASYLTRTPIPDLNSGLRVFRRDVAMQFLHLLPSGFSCVTTMTMTFLANGYSVRYIPIDYAPRVGYSKFHWRKDTTRYLLQVVRMVLLYNPLRALVPPALIFLTLGVGKLVYDIQAYDWRVATNTLLLFTAAFLVGLTALIADLLVQLNMRPNDATPAALYVSDGEPSRESVRSTASALPDDAGQSPTPKPTEGARR
jgi:polyisoprenyl-phosphate glycosyltransferase